MFWGQYIEYLDIYQASKISIYIKNTPFLTGGKQCTATYERIFNMREDSFGLF